ncbi:MAG: glucose-1-phosphate adenylyltransferase subunit GlgD, partial [Eubacteriales bacterium]|nr:glucose-1-phosphate adenylyltransferase subunit GlgD [Eubacteriales bacterium]
KYNHNSEARNSLVASGTNIKGHVENSIIFREAKIEEGAKVKNCVIMQQCVIGENSVVVNAVLDKYVKIGSNKILVGTLKEPLIIKKDSII